VSEALTYAPHPILSALAPDQRSPPHARPLLPNTNVHVIRVLDMGMAKGLYGKWVLMVVLGLVLALGLRACWLRGWMVLSGMGLGVSIGSMYSHCDERGLGV
jgi:hypothetical protein